MLRFLCNRRHDFYSLGRNSQVKEKGRGDIYLPPVSICSKHYSHTASRSYCNFTTTKLELCAYLPVPDSWHMGVIGLQELFLIIVFHWAMVFCHSSGSQECALFDTLEIICHLWFVLAMRNDCGWQAWRKPACGGWPGRSSLTAGPLEEGQNGRGTQEHLRSRKAAPTQRLTPPQSLFKQLAQGRG